MSGDARARRENARNRALTHRASFSVARLEIHSSSVFADQTIEIPPMLAVVGRHGTGKSALQRLVAAAFGYFEPEASRPSLRTQDTFDFDGHVDVTVTIGGELVQRAVDLTLSLEARQAIWSDLPKQPYLQVVAPGTVQARLSSFNQEYGALEAWQWPDLVPLKEAGKEDLAAINRILSRRYERLSVFEFDGIAPRFTAGRDGREVDNAAMSDGELSYLYLAHYALYWGESGPVLIDEPESGIAPRAHYEVMQDLARLSIGNDVQLIVGTHSPEIMYWFPLSSILMAVPTPNGILYAGPKSQDEVADHLGYPKVVRVLVLVEDSFAGQLLKMLCEVLDRRWIRGAEVVDCSGEGEVRNAFRVMARSRAFPIAAVLDGDQRGKSTPIDGIRAELYLPGTTEPEAVLLEIAAQYRGRFAELVERSEQDVASALYEAQGVEHQTVLSVVARWLNVSSETLLRALVVTLASDQTMREQCLDLLDEIEHRIETFAAPSGGQ